LKKASVLSRTQKHRKIIRFCEFWQASSGQTPRLLVFDSTLTTHAELAELDDRGIGFITPAGDQTQRRSTAAAAAAPH
jgi:hypothetical protein